MAAIVVAAALVAVILAVPARATDSPAVALLTLINEYRALQGGAPLATDATLADVARRHGADMAARGYFSHVSPDGDDLARRLSAAGYRFAVAAENLAQGYRDPAAVLAGWQGSRGHLRNLLRDDVSRAGIGVVESAASGSGPVWVLILAQPRP